MLLPHEHWTSDEQAKWRVLSRFKLISSSISESQSTKICFLINSKFGWARKELRWEIDLMCSSKTIVSHFLWDQVCIHVYIKDLISPLGLSQWALHAPCKRRSWGIVNYSLWILRELSLLSRWSYDCDENSSGSQHQVVFIVCTLLWMTCCDFSYMLTVYFKKMHVVTSAGIAVNYGW